MKRLKWSALALGIACLLVLAQTGTFKADDQKPPPPRHDGNLLRGSLKEVINTGAELFNKYGDHAGCYRLYQGALIAIKPFLAPDTQKEIEGTLAEAEKLPRFSDRAFALRKTINSIRGSAEAKGAEKAAKDQP